MRDRIMRAAGAVFCATVAFMPVSALAFVNKASSNFDLVSLSDAELSARSIKIIDMGNVELTSGLIVAADPLAQPVRLYEAFEKKGNAALFWSGWGDGFHPVFWGLDKSGRPLVLLTDFQVTENADGRREPNHQ